MKKNQLVAFMLSAVPGAGFLYLNKKIRAAMYSFLFFGTIIFSLGLCFLFNDDDFLIFLGGAIIVWIIQMIDMVIYLLHQSEKDVINLQQHKVANSHNEQQGMNPTIQDQETVANPNDKSTIMLLSIIPGLGHMNLGLTQRGLTFLISSFGFVTVIFFVTFLSEQPTFLVFLGLTPIIWIYSMFDVQEQVKRRERGEELLDRTFFEDFEESRKDSRKSKAIATLLALFPGTGHLYLGLQKRGIQLMAAFLFSIYIMDVMRLSLFLFLIPLIWFYSFFDALQQVSKQENKEQDDLPIFTYFQSKQKWIGIALLLLGLYYMFDSVLLPTLQPIFVELFQVDLYNLYVRYFQTFVVSTLLIGGGIKLLIGSEKRGSN